MNQDNKKALHLTDDNFDQTIKDSDVPVFVDFYAEWCGPCKMAAPVVDKLSQDADYQGKIKIVKVNVDENRETASKYQVMSIPTVVVLKSEDGEIKELERQVGFPGESGFRNLIESIIK